MPEVAIGLMLALWACLSLTEKYSSNWRLFSNHKDLERAWDHWRSGTAHPGRSTRRERRCSMSRSWGYRSVLSGKQENATGFWKRLLYKLYVRPAVFQEGSRRCAGMSASQAA